MTTALAIALAIGGIIALVAFHELGHFFAAKATGMRVEKLYLFFGPKLVSVKRGETEYGIAALPFGGYAKITGMNPDEELPPEVAPRAYYNQPVWKRIVVILAGPVVNVLIAFLIFFGTAFGLEEATDVGVGAIVEGSPADGKLERGDRIVSIDGVSAAGLGPDGRAERFAALVNRHRCAGELRDGCRSQEPVRAVVRRDGERIALRMRPYYDAEVQRIRLGFTFVGADYQPADPSVPEAAEASLDAIWFVTSETVSTFAQIFKAEEREKLGSVVGAVEVTRQAIQFDAEVALRVVGFVSLSLALINLFPFLPLDGGHVFWSLVEKVRGRRVPFDVMERASALGLMLFLLIFVIGLSNDIDRFSDGGFDLR